MTTNNGGNAATQTVTVTGNGAAEVVVEGHAPPERTKPPREDLVRVRPSDITLTREEGDGQGGDGMPTLTGHFATFNDWTEINSHFEGHFMERIAPGAFDKTFQEGRDAMRVLFQHGMDPQIGDKPLGPIETLESDERGAFYEVPMFDTGYNRDLVPGLEAGVYGASFRFRVVKEDFRSDPKESEFNPEGIPERTITEAQVMEFGPVTFPAYGTATAGVRSQTERFSLARLLRAAIEEPEALRDALELALGKEGERTAAEEEAEDSTEEVEKHGPNPYTAVGRIEPLKPEGEDTEGSRSQTTQPRREDIYPYPKEMPSWRI